MALGYNPIGGHAGKIECTLYDRSDETPAFDTITLYIFDFAEDRVESEGSVSFTNINLVLMEDHKGWHKKFTCSLINSARINPFDMENAKNIKELGRFVNLIKTQPNKYRLSIKYRDGVNITRISDAMLLGSMFPEELLSNSSIGQAIRIEFIDKYPSWISLESGASGHAIIPEAENDESPEYVFVSETSDISSGNVSILTFE